MRTKQNPIWKRIEPQFTKPGTKCVIFFDEDDRDERTEVKFLGRKRDLFLFKDIHHEHTIYGLPKRKVKKLVFSEE